MLKWVGKHDKLVVDLSNEVADLSKTVEKLVNREAAREREHRELVLEWKTSYEKFNTLWQRLYKRIPKKGPDGPQEPAEPEPSINPLAVELMRSRRNL